MCIYTYVHIYIYIYIYIYTHHIVNDHTQLYYYIKDNYDNTIAE